VLSGVLTITFLYSYSITNSLSPHYHFFNAVGNLSILCFCSGGWAHGKKEISEKTRAFLENPTKYTTVNRVSQFNQIIFQGINFFLIKNV